MCTGAGRSADVWHATPVNPSLQKHVPSGLQEPCPLHGFSAPPGHSLEQSVPSMRLRV